VTEEGRKMSRRRYFLYEKEDMNMGNSIISEDNAERASQITSHVKVILLCLALACEVSAKDNNRKEIGEALKSKYELAKVGIDHFRITKPGTVLVVQKDGIYANPSTDNGTVTTTIKDGQLSEPGGVMGAFFSQGQENRNRTLKTGEKVYVTRIEMWSGSIRFDIVTCDTSDTNIGGNSRQIRYVSQLAFKLPKEFLETADVDAVKKIVDAVIIPESEAQAANTKTVELGQTADQVKSALGAPDKIIKLGPKEIYVYKDMKVVFMDGKVSDVQ
jgi:hypothetical protein